MIRRLPSQLSCIFPQAVFVIRTQTMIHRFPSKSTAHSQKTFVSNLTRKRRITNKSPFKDVYPLINADSLMTNICNVVREIFAIIVSVMVIQTQNFINLTRTLRFWKMLQNRDKLVQNFKSWWWWGENWSESKYGVLLLNFSVSFFFLIVTSFDYTASISQLVSLRPISPTAGLR